MLPDGNERWVKFHPEVPKAGTRAFVAFDISSNLKAFRS